MTEPANLAEAHERWLADHCSDCGHPKGWHHGGRCGIDCPCPRKWLQ